MVDIDVLDFAIRAYLIILGSGDFSLPAEIAEDAEPRRRVVVFLEKKIGEWGPSF